MKIYNGIFRGAEIEFGICDGTSGQMYVEFKAGGERLKRILKKLNEKRLRKILQLPEENSNDFAFHFIKKENSFNWRFMFARMRNRNQLEYLYGFCQYVQELYKLDGEDVEGKKNDAKN